MSYECRKCLNEVFLTGQWLKAHIKHCKGLKTEAAKEKPATSYAKRASSSSSNSKKKKKHKAKSQQPDLQPDSQTLPPTTSQVSSCRSPHCSGCKSQKLLLPLQRSQTLAAKILGRSIPSATSTPARRTRCTSLTDTRRLRRSNMAFPQTGRCPSHVTPFTQCICRL